MAKPSAKTKPNAATKLVSENRRARHHYELFDRFEAGIALTGSEVKSMRQGQMNLRDSYCTVRGTAAFLVGAYIAPYSHAGYAGHDPERSRKLLLRKGELLRVGMKVRERGLTLIPLRVYFKRGLAKLEMALAKGRKVHDKREAIKERDRQRDQQRYKEG